MECLISTLLCEMSLPSLRYQSNQFLCRELLDGAAGVRTEMGHCRCGFSGFGAGAYHPGVVVVKELRADEEA